MIVFLLILMVIAIAASWWLLQGAPSEFESHLADTLMQLAVIGGLGMLADIFFKRLERARAKASRDNGLRLEMLKRLRTAHGAIARARRLISWHKTGLTYGEQLRDLMIVHSELEEINVDTKTYENLFREAQDGIIENVARLANYLEKGIIEYGENYKKKLSGTIGEQYQKVESEMEWLKDFVKDGGPFKKEYEGPLTAAKTAMRQEIYRKG